MRSKVGRKGIQGNLRQENIRVRDDQVKRDYSFVDYPQVLNEPVGPRWLLEWKDGSVTGRISWYPKPLGKKTVNDRLDVLAMDLGNRKLGSRRKGWVLEVDEDQSMMARHYRSRGVSDYRVNAS